MDDLLLKELVLLELQVSETHNHFREASLLAGNRQVSEELDVSENWCLRYWAPCDMV